MTSEELARMRARGCHKAGAWQRRPGFGTWAPEQSEEVLSLAHENGVCYDGGES